MADKKPSTADILKLARAQGAKGGDAASPKSTASSGVAPSETGQPAAPSDIPKGSSEAPAASSPQSTADILAAARGQSGGAAKKPAAAGVSVPKSTADILAAARAKGGGSGKPAAPKSTADILAAARGGGKVAENPGGAVKEVLAAKVKPAAALPTGETPSVQEMLRAVREIEERPRGQPVVVAEAEQKPEGPRLPAKKLPAAAKPPNAAKASSRRSVMLAVVATPFALAWTMFSLATGAFTLALARFMMPNVLVEPPTKFKIGPLSDYPPGAVITKWKAARGIWVVNTDQYNGKSLVYALASICTHLGCTPNWLEGEQKFKCPCHGSGFYKTGVNFEGPAPRPLERVGIRVAEDGMLEVDKSVKFQEEMGQWEDGASFVEVA